MQERQRQQQELQALYRRVEENPFDIDAQRRVEELIRAQNVESNHKLAQVSGEAVAMAVVNCVQLLTMLLWLPVLLTLSLPLLPKLLLLLVLVVPWWDTIDD